MGRIDWINKVVKAAKNFISEETDSLSNTTNSDNNQWEIASSGIEALMWSQDTPTSKPILPVDSVDWEPINITQPEKTLHKDIVKEQNGEDTNDESIVSTIIKPFKWWVEKYVQTIDTADKRTEQVIDETIWPLLYKKIIEPYKIRQVKHEVIDANMSGFQEIPEFTSFINKIESIPDDDTIVLSSAKKGIDVETAQWLIDGYRWFNFDMAQAEAERKNLINKWMSNEDATEIFARSYMWLNKKYFGKYWEQWLSNDSLLKLQDLYNSYSADIKPKMEKILPDNKDWEVFLDKFNVSKKIWWIYVDTLKEFWVEITDDPYTISRSALISNKISNDVLQLKWFVNLTEDQQKYLIDKAIETQTTWIKIQAMRDAWLSKNDIDDRAKSQWLDTYKFKYDKEWFNTGLSDNSVVSSLFLNPINIIPYTLSNMWLTNKMDKIYEEAEAMDLEAFKSKIGSAWDINNFISRWWASYYSNTIEPIFDLFNLAKVGSLNKYWYWDIAEWLKRSDNYKWNKWVDLVKKWTEVAAVTLAVFQTAWLWAWATTSIWLWSSATVWAVAEWAVSLLARSWVQDRIVESALKANYSTMQFDESDQIVNLAFWTLWAVLDWANRYRQINIVNEWFNRFMPIPEVAQLSYWFTMTPAEKLAIMETLPSVISMVRVINNGSPELGNFLLKNAVFKKQVNRFIKDEIVPFYQDALKRNKWNIEIATEETNKFFKDKRDKFYIPKKADIQNPLVTVDDIIQSEPHLIKNSIQDAPKLVDIERWIPKSSTDSVENALNIYYPMKPTQISKISLNSIIPVKAWELKDVVINTIRTVLKYDVKWANRLVEFVTFKNPNGKDIFFNEWVVNDNLVSIFSVKWLDIKTSLKQLNKQALHQSFLNSVNNSSVLVGEIKYGKIQYREAIKEEVVNPDIPKFKIDWNQIVPTITTTDSMIQWKKIWWTWVDLEIEAKNVWIKSVEWHDYVSSPIELSKPLKENTSYTWKLPADEAQKLYIDYANKVSDKFNEIKFIEDNDLYVKTYLLRSEPTNIAKHTMTAKLLDFIIEQRDSLKLLEIIKNARWEMITRFINYIENSSQEARSLMLSSYKWEHKTVLNRLNNLNYIKENIHIKNFMADLLLEKWLFSTKSKAYTYVTNNYEKLMSYSIISDNTNNVENLINCSPISISWKDHIVYNALSRYFDSVSDDIVDLWKKTWKGFRIYETTTLPYDIAWRADISGKQILINSFLTYKHPEIFWHEFGHIVYYYLNDEALAVVNSAYNARHDEVIWIIKKKFNVDDSVAEEIIKANSTYKDRKWIYYLWDEYYDAKSVHEFWAESFSKHLVWKSVVKKIKSIIDKIIRFFYDLARDIIKTSKDAWSLNKILDDINSYIKNNVDLGDIKDVHYKIRWNIEIEYKNQKRIPKISTDDVSNKVSASKAINKIPLSQKLETQIIKYIDDNWWLSLPYLNQLEDFIDLHTSYWSASNKETKRMLFKYYDMFFNWNVRDIVDFSLIDNFWSSIEEAYTVKDIKVDVEHELLLNKSRLNATIEDMWLKKDNYNTFINSLIKSESKKLWEIVTRKVIDDAIMRIKDKLMIRISEKSKKKWTVDPIKINKIMDLVANTNFEKRWNIISVEFITPKNWNKDFSQFVFNEAYKANNIVLPLPWKTTSIVIDSWKLISKSKMDVPWHEIEFMKAQAKELVSALKDKWKDVYIFTDNYNLVKHWDILTSDLIIDNNIIFVNPTINQTSLKIEDWFLRIWSYNENVFDNLKRQIAQVVKTKSDSYLSDTAMIDIHSIDFDRSLSQYFFDTNIDINIEDMFKYKDISYFINLISSKKSIKWWNYDYMFVNTETSSSELFSRWIVMPDTVSIIDDILEWIDITKYKVTRWFIETINNNLWFTLKDKFSFSVEKKPLIDRMVLRSYISNNYADAMFAKLKLLRQFMEETPENTSKYRELMAGISHNAITNTANISNPVIRDTVKNLVFNDLLNSWLPAAMQSYIMTINNVTDYILGNMSEVDTMVNNLLQFKWDIMDPRVLESFTLPSKLSAFLDNYFELNKNWLIKYYMHDIANARAIEDVGAEIDEMSTFSNDIFSKNKTAQKWLALMYLYDKVKSVVDNVERIKNNMNFTFYEDLSSWYYLVDKSIFNYIYWITDVDVDGIIKSSNFDKQLKLSNTEMSEYLNNTSWLLEETKSNVISFFDNIIEWWEKLSSSTEKYFYKKRKIDNLFWETHYQLHNYVKFLENNFWWTTSSNKIISSLNQKIFNIWKFTRVNEETLAIYKQLVSDALAEIDVWHAALLDELKNIWWDFDIDRLLRSWKTAKLSLWEDVNWDKLIITDSYSLNDFVVEEAAKLWYSVDLWSLETISTSTAQLKLIWMYWDVLQKAIDDVSVWMWTQKQITLNYKRTRMVKNPFFYKGNIILEWNPYVTKKAQNFFNPASMPWFSVYAILNDDSLWPKLLNKFFNNLLIEMDGSAINAIDITTKQLITTITEWYIRNIEYNALSRDNNIKKIVTFAFFKSISIVLDSGFYKTFTKHINKSNIDITQYMNNLFGLTSGVKSTLNNKLFDSKAIINFLQKNNNNFKYISWRLNSFVTALADMWSPNEAVSWLMKWKYILNLSWERIPMIDIVNNPKYKAIFNAKMAEIESFMDEQIDLAIHEDNMEYGSRWSDNNETLKDINYDPLDQVYWKSYKNKNPDWDPNRDSNRSSSRDDEEEIWDLKSKKYKEMDPEEKTMTKVKPDWAIGYGDIKDVIKKILSKSTKDYVDSSGYITNVREFKSPFYDVLERERDAASKDIESLEKYLSQPYAEELNWDRYNVGDKKITEDEMLLWLSEIQKNDSVIDDLFINCIDI